jgi:alginate O-acetyltransferase complex protein AlgI
LLVDVYREKDLKHKQLIDVSFPVHAKKTLFFISFFPHLVSGPILKAHHFYPQITVKRFNQIHWDACFRALVAGYFLKMVCADNLKDFTFWLSFPYGQTRSSFDLLAMLFGYSFQIFADFAGYSLIAIGLAKLFGYDFQQNFNFPYISTSFKEFWKRWHISLSTFLMEYLYIPLGGNKKGPARTYVNLMITMVLGGLWHGAAWSYAIWGAVHGGALVVERFLDGKITLKPNRLLAFIKGCVVFLFITFAWLLFKLPNFKDVVSYFHALANNIHLNDDVNLQANIVLYSLPVVGYHLIYLLRNYSFFNRVRRTEYVYYSLMLFLIITNSGSTGTFVYFQF